MPSVMKIILGLTLNLPTLQPPPVENRLISYYRILCSNTKTVLTFIKKKRQKKHFKTITCTNKTRMQVEITLKQNKL